MTAPSGGSTVDPGKLYLTFTGLLYGVVIDAALHHIEGLRIFEEDSVAVSGNGLLVIALLIVVQDFYFYHRDVPSIPSKRSYLVFPLDILVLGAWYALSLSARITYQHFLYCLTIFFIAIVVWDLSIRISFRELFERFDSGPPNILMTHIPVSIVGLILSSLCYFGALNGHVGKALLLLLLLFVAWRICYWTHLPLVDRSAEGTNPVGVPYSPPDN